jgi:hypothetical protein
MWRKTHLAIIALPLLLQNIAYDYVIPLVLCMSLRDIGRSDAQPGGTDFLQPDEPVIMHGVVS